MTTDRPKSSGKLVILFTRYPVAGRAKTRLAAALGQRGAADLHRALAEHARERIEPLVARGVAEFEVHYDGASVARMRRWLGPGTPLVRQADGDLGQRMYAALADAAARGHSQTLLVGTDVPAINAPLLERAFAGLDAADLVLGPALDGGYYLVGTGAPRAALFSRIPWGSGAVFDETVARARQLGLTLVEVDRLADIDGPADLRRLAPYPRFAAYVSSTAGARAAHQIDENGDD